ncbi:MAG: tetratricopeptide repeat protein [Myxococcota bacterium]
MADLNWEVDPEQIDESLRKLRDQLKKLYDQGRYTKVRFKYKGKPLGPDVPMAALVAGEALSLALAGPLRFLVFNLGVKAFVEIEFLHEASERVREGQELFGEGEVDAAEAKYREALSMKEDDTSALYNLGVLLRVTGRRDEAIAAFEKAAKDGEHPDGVKAKEALEKMQRGLRTL